MKLIKMSSPGWEQEFETENELKQELFKWICGDCKEGNKEFDDDGNLLYEGLPVNIDSSVDEMLSTACGCEFTTDREVNEYVVNIEKHDDNYLIPFSEESMTKLGWVEDDLLEWEDNLDGSFTIRKYYND